jgi:hypothetical protein
LDKRKPRGLICRSSYVQIPTHDISVDSQGDKKKKGVQEPPLGCCLSKQKQDNNKHRKKGIKSQKCSVWMLVVQNTVENKIPRFQMERKEK